MTEQTMPLELHAISLQDIFDQNCGFYIPNFQREFSWSSETAEKLVADVENTLKIKINNPHTSHDFFVGSMIFLRKNPEIGLVLDDHRISNSVYTVIDGQQRLTTLAVLGAVLQERIYESIARIEQMTSDLARLVTHELKIRHEQLSHWQSFNVRNYNASPRDKPIIIRSLDASTLRATDQWTLCQEPKHYYRSDIAIFLQCRIEGMSVADIGAQKLAQSSLIGRVSAALIEFFRSPYDRFLTDYEDKIRLELLVKKLSEISERPDLWEDNESWIDQLSRAETSDLIDALYLLLYCEILVRKTTVVMIKTDEAALAYDMFQSINGTGVPLTTIEVIKPDLVAKYVTAYGIQVQPRISEIENHISNLVRAKPALKPKITADVICDLARSYEGNTHLTRVFSDQRGFLKKVIDETNAAECLIFLDLLEADLRYRYHFTRSGSSSEDKRTELIRLGMQFSDADLIVTLISFLNESNHDYAHKVLTIFYSKLVIARRSNVGAVEGACQDLLGAAKACVAFFTLWTGLGQSRFPDSVYKSLFTGLQNITHKYGNDNQGPDFLCRSFLTALNEVMRRTLGESFNRDIWTKAFIKNPIYRKRAVAKFSLMVAHHDALPDFQPGNGGLLRDGPIGSAGYLTISGWERYPNTTLEHIAAQNPPRAPEFEKCFDRSIYEPDPSVVHRIGNLTFLSGSQNQMASNAEWPEKLFMYWSLTNRGAAGHLPRDELMRSLGIERTPPSLQALTEGAEFVHHLAPIVQFGLENSSWDLTAIERRGMNIAQRVFNKLSEWLT